MCKCIICKVTYNTHDNTYVNTEYIQCRKSSFPLIDAINIISLQCANDMWLHILEYQHGFQRGKGYLIPLKTVLTASDFFFFLLKILDLDQRPYWTNALPPPVFRTVLPV